MKVLIFFLWNTDISETLKILLRIHSDKKDQGREATRKLLSHIITWLRKLPHMATLIQLVVVSKGLKHRGFLCVHNKH